MGEPRRRIHNPRCSLHGEGVARFVPRKGGILINLEEIALDGDGHRPYQVLFHETSHNLDWILGGGNDYFSRLYRDGVTGKSFGEALFADAYSLRQQVADELNAKWRAETNAKWKKFNRLREEYVDTGVMKPGTFRWLIRNGAAEASRDYLDDLGIGEDDDVVGSDLFEGMRRLLEAETGKPTNEQILAEVARRVHKGLDRRDADVDDILQSVYGDDYLKHAYFGHRSEDGTPYFESRATAHIVEPFADMMDAQLSNPGAWKAIQRAFPTASKMFTTMIKEAANA